MATNCKGCKMIKDAEYIRAACAACRANGGHGHFEAEREDSAAIDRRNAEGFAVTINQIRNRDDLSPQEITIIVLLQLGYTLTAVGEMWGCTRANVAYIFKRLRERCPHYRQLMDWTPHGGRVAVTDAELDEMIEECRLTQGELGI